MEKIAQFLDETKTYYLATTEGDQPRVRPFGTILLYNGKLYIQTGKSKSVSRQLAKDPKAEICAFNGETWLRVAGELVNDDDRAAKVAMLEKYPDLKGMYDPDDGNTQVLYFKDAVATFSSFTAAPETVHF
ncbi:MAG: pyridoxamine 5'-phosphate oxidase family protein [Clostridia bacterium]|nr:pyridoxamine 5'-phosphate oxidase family protein [Clostridia bacterium]